MWFLISGGVLATLSAFPTATTPPDDMSDKACIGAVTVPTAYARLLESRTPHPPTETPAPQPRIIYLAHPSAPATITGIPSSATEPQPTPHHPPTRQRPATQTNAQTVYGSPRDANTPTPLPGTTPTSRHPKDPTLATLTIALPPEACANTTSTEQPLKQAGTPHPAASSQSAVQWARAERRTWDNSAIAAWLQKWHSHTHRTPEEWFTPATVTNPKPTTPNKDSGPLWNGAKPSEDSSDSWYGKLPKPPWDNTEPPNTSWNAPQQTNPPTNDDTPNPPEDRSAPSTPKDNTDPPPKPPTQSKGEIAADAALARLGTPFSWGGGSSSGPTRGIGRGATTVGFDCSGLALYAWSKAGINLGHYTGTQFHQGKPISLGDLRKGDLLFFGGGSGDPTHVGIYLGAGVMIHAPKTGDVVKKTQFLNSTYYRPIYRGAVRPG